MASPLQLTETTDYAAWDALVAQSPQGTVFSSSRFLLSLGQPFRLFQIVSQNKVVAMLAAIEDDSGRKLIQFDFTPYQGILFAAGPKALPRQRVVDEFRITEFFIEQLTARYDEVGMALSWHFDDVRPFLWHNYHEPQRGQFASAPRYTAILDLDAIEIDDYPMDVRACRRQEWRKAAPYVIDRHAGLDQFIALYAETFARQDIALPEKTLSLVRAIAAAAVEHGYGSLCSCATPDGVAAMTLFIYDGARAYYLFAANNPDLRNTGAATGLMFDNIFEAKRRGMRELDFVGANSPNRADFKLSFNPELKLYFDLRYKKPAAA